jgi:lipopolysaccharide/colanic/teichoic acid biosynthesis glycosyltransferase
VDVVVSGLLGLLCLPLFVVIAVAVKLGSPGPLFVKQIRIGERGRPFTLYKFRSLSLQNGSELSTLDRKPEADRPGMTTGRFLRRWRLDELPELWNVFKGDMSLVGPHPEEARFVLDHYSDQQRRRLAIKPGLTGPMQVHGQADLPAEARVQLELEYIDHYSFWRDALILAQTIPAVLKGSVAR